MRGKVGLPRRCASIVRRNPGESNCRQSALFRSSCPGLSRASTSSCLLVEKKSWTAGRRRAEATPSFGRLGPAMTAVGNNRPSFGRLRRALVTPEIDHSKRGADALGGAVLEADHGVDGDIAPAAIDGIDDISVFLVDD